MQMGFTVTANLQQHWEMELKEYDNNDDNIVNKGKPVSFSCYK